ncbi:MAG: bifunctional metallophosphatase/5'-nucleotidase [Candidatus Aminicenantes bacterium]|nr:bifunctional metallophosphatase/5'-nucleotidase [Candidatus Aminicenantes bacterium]
MIVKKVTLKITAGLIAAGLVLFALTGALNLFPDQRNAEVIITIFHINDTHSRIDNFARIARFVKEAKKKNPNVFFLNAGDNFSGNPIVDQYEPKGLPMREMLILSGTDALALGNHEFDYGQEILEQFIEQVSFPVLCANIKVTPEAVITQPQPYVILQTKGGIKIALLGLLQIGKKTRIPSTHPAKLKGLKFFDGVETAKKYKYLRGKCDIFIALSHLGYETDKRLAKEVGGLDIIVGGHSHHLLEKPERVNGVLITQAGAYSKYLGRIDITLKDGKITGIDAGLIKVASLKEEIPEIKKRIAVFNNNPRLNRIIGTLPEALEGKPVLGNLITDAIRKIHGLDMGFHNWGGTRAYRIGKEIRLRDIYTLLPFGNDIIRFEMTPAEIKNLIRFDFKRHDHLELFVSGITYVVKHSTGKEIKEIQLRDEQGKLLDESKTYKVGINDYIVSAYTFTHRDPGQSLRMTVAESLIQYLKKGKGVTRGIKNTRIRTEVVNE